MIPTTRTYSPAPAVRHAEIPLYQLGWAQKLQKVQRGMGEVRVPKIPLHQLGWAARGAARGLGASGATTAIQAAGAIGGKIAASAATSAASAAGWGAAAGPIGAGVAVAVGLIVGLIAGHEARVKGATNENQAANTAITGFYSILKQIVAAYNAGQLDTNSAIQQIENLDQSTYSALRSHVGAPGTAWNSSTSGVCNKSCTVGCCLYNSYLHVAAITAISFLQSGGGGTLNLGGIGSNHYGLQPYPKFTLTINPPSATSSAVSSLESDLGIGASSPAGSSSMLPLLLLGGAAFLLLR